MQVHRYSVFRCAAPSYEGHTVYKVWLESRGIFSFSLDKHRNQPDHEQIPVRFNNDIALNDFVEKEGFFHFQEWDSVLLKRVEHSIVEKLLKEREFAMTELCLKHYPCPLPSRMVKKKRTKSSGPGEFVKCFLTEEFYQVKGEIHYPIACTEVLRYLEDTNKRIVQYYDFVVESMDEEEGA